VHLHLGWVHEARQALPEAIAEYEKTVALTAREPVAVAALARALAAAGRRDEAHKLLVELLGRQRERYLPPVEMASVCFALGESDSSLEWLKRAEAERSASLLYLPRHAWAAGLRSAPALAGLLQALKLPT